MKQSDESNDRRITDATSFFDEILLPRLANPTKGKITKEELVLMMECFQVNHPRAGERFDLAHVLCVAYGRDCDYSQRMDVDSDQLDLVHRALQFLTELRPWLT